MAKISIFDCTGTLLEEVKEDESKFGIKLTHKPGEDFMGFKSFEINGPEESINAFCEFYDLQLDP